MELRIFCVVAIFFFVLFPSVLCKSTRYAAASFRAGANTAAKKESSFVTPNEEEQELEWGLYLTSVKHATPSLTFEKFAQGARAAFVPDSKAARTYYFAKADTPLEVDLLVNKNCFSFLFGVHVI